MLRFIPPSSTSSKTSLRPTTSGRTKAAPPEKEKTPPSTGHWPDVGQFGRAFRNLGLAITDSLVPDTLHQAAVQELQQWGLSENAAQQLAQQPGYALAHAQVFGGDALIKAQHGDAGLLFSVCERDWDSAASQLIGLLCDAWLSAAPPLLACQLLNTALPRLPDQARDLLSAHAAGLLDTVTTPQPEASRPDMAEIAKAIGALAANGWCAESGPAAVPADLRVLLTTVAQQLHPPTGLSVELQSLRQGLPTHGKGRLAPEQALALLKQLEDLLAQALAFKAPLQAQQAVKLAEAVARRCPDDATVQERCTALGRQNQRARTEAALLAMQPWCQSALSRDRSGKTSVKVAVEASSPWLQDPATPEQVRECLRALTDGPDRPDWEQIQQLAARFERALPKPPLLSPDDWAELACNQVGGTNQLGPLLQVLRDARAGSIAPPQLERALRRLAAAQTGSAPPDPEQQAALLRELSRLMPPTEQGAALHQTWLSQLAQLAARAPDSACELWARYAEQHPLPEERSARLLVPLVLEALTVPGQKAETRQRLAQRLANWIPAAVQVPSSAHKQLRDTERQFELLSSAIRRLPRAQRIGAMLKIEQSCRVSLQAMSQRHHRPPIPLELTMLQGFNWALLDASGQQPPAPDDFKAYGRPEREFFRRWGKVLHLRGQNKPDEARQAHHKMLSWFSINQADVYGCTDQLLPLSDLCFQEPRQAEAQMRRQRPAQLDLDA